MAIPEHFAHNTWLTLPLAACAHWLKPAEKLVKDQLIEREMARESHMIEAMVRGYQNSLRFRLLASLLR